MPRQSSLKILFLLLVAIPLSSQQGFPLKKIEFDGLVKTKKSFLFSMLDSKINQHIDLGEVEDGLQALKNLPSVAFADYRLDTVDQNIFLTYLIEERKTALPIINFGGIEGNIWFSLGFIENNFRGNGDLLLAFYQNNNGLHSGQVFMRKPRINGSDWGYSFTLNKWSSEEPVFFSEGTVKYTYDNNGVSLSLLRNIGLNNLIEVGGTYFVESYNKLERQDFENAPGPDNFRLTKVLSKVLLKRNYLNYHFFYLTGYEAFLNYQNVYTAEQNLWFNSLQFQGRYFTRPSEKLNMAFRLKLAISTNEDSPFAPFVADSHVNIRGIGNRIDRGTAQVVLNVEARYTVLHRKYWSSQLVAFADNGTWRNPGGQLTDIFNSDAFRQFIGLGFRVNYQRVFGASIRVDYGIDIHDKSQRGFVIGLGQYF